jgi:hypothetical protein
MRSRPIRSLRETRNSEHKNGNNQQSSLHGVYLLDDGRPIVSTIPASAFPRNPRPQVGARSAYAHFDVPLTRAVTKHRSQYLNNQRD